MKICISSTGKDLESIVDRRFGRCPYFVVVNTDNKQTRAIDNRSAQSARGAGVGAAQLVVNEGCKVVVTGNMGPNAFQVLNSAGINVWEAGAISCEEALRKYNDGELSPINEARRGGCGFGRGRRGGRGSGRNR